MASTVADNVSTTLSPLSANSSRKSLRLRARAPMIASGYTYAEARSPHRVAAQLGRTQASSGTRCRAAGRGGSAIPAESCFPPAR
jgi:hypothetical protein